MLILKITPLIHFQFNLLDLEKSGSRKTCYTRRKETNGNGNATTPIKYYGNEDE